MFLSAFLWVPDSLTEACTWKVSGGGSPESWRGGRPWRAKAAARSAASLKTLQIGFDWIRSVPEAGSLKRTKRKTGVVLTTQTELPDCGGVTEQLCAEEAGWTWGQGPQGQADSSSLAFIHSPVLTAESHAPTWTDYTLQTITIISLLYV